MVSTVLVPASSMGRKETATVAIYLVHVSGSPLCLINSRLNPSSICDTADQHRLEAAWSVLVSRPQPSTHTQAPSKKAGKKGVGALLSGGGGGAKAKVAKVSSGPFDAYGRPTGVRGSRRRSPPGCPI